MVGGGVLEVTPSDGAGTSKEHMAGEVEFPPKYSDLSQVFDEAECEVLSPHRSTDCAIELVPGA